MNIMIDKKRVPCPLDPSHNCFEDQLEKHLKKCNVAKLRRATEQCEFFVSGVNKGMTIASDEDDVENVSVANMTSEQLASMIDKVNKLYKDHVHEPKSEVLEHQSVMAAYAEDNSGNLADNPGLRKEMLQQASLIGQLDSVGLLNDTSWFVELGAGKGKLSHWVEKASPPESQSSFLLVDRSSVRYKMDNQHKEDGGVSKFKRIKVDIADLCLGYVSELQSTNSVVVMGKHLCGGATDLGIRCAVDSLAMNHATTGTEEVDAEPPAKAKKIDKVNSKLPRGMMVALCCHHRCDWATYVGRDFMTSCGVTPREFDLLTRLSSWATCARTRVKNEEKVTEGSKPPEKKRKDIRKNKLPNPTSDNKPQTEKQENRQEKPVDHLATDLVTSAGSTHLRESLSVTERESIGRKCKRLIDQGRLVYLTERGLACCLRAYVDEEITPENVVLLVTRKGEGLS